MGAAILFAPTLMFKVSLEDAGVYTFGCENVLPSKNITKENITNTVTGIYNFDHSKHKIISD